jgi:hypothetical protein
MHKDVTQLLELSDLVGIRMMIDIADAVLVARKKHQTLGFGAKDALTTIRSEMLEFESQAMLVETQACKHNSRRKQSADREALDVIATLVRWIAGEFYV